MSTISTYTVQGMTCGSCATKVRSAVDGVPGVTETDVDVVNGRLAVTGQDVDDASVRKAISEAGYKIH